MQLFTEQSLNAFLVYSLLIPEKNTFNVCTVTPKKKKNYFDKFFVFHFETFQQSVYLFYNACMLRADVSKVATFTLPDVIVMHIYFQYRQMKINLLFEESCLCAFSTISLHSGKERM